MAQSERAIRASEAFAEYASNNPDLQTALASSQERIARFCQLMKSDEFQQHLAEVINQWKQEYRQRTGEDLPESWEELEGGFTALGIVGSIAGIG